MKKLCAMLLALAMVLSWVPTMASATEKEYVYLSVSFDGKYIEDKNGNTMVYVPVDMEKVRAIDLTEYDLDVLLYDADGDGEYETTALQLLIYAHEELYGGKWSDVVYEVMPGSSYFKDGIFGFTENLVYFLNGDFPVDDSQQSDFMTVGATAERIVLEAGDFIDVASFSCYSFLWDQLGGFHFFADEEGTYIHDVTVGQGEELTVNLRHSFCDLMYGQAWVVGASDYEIYYGTVFGEAEGSVMTDGEGFAQITFPSSGTYYLWCDGGIGSDDGTHGGCDHYNEYYEPCIVSAPAYAKVTVQGEEKPVEPMLQEEWKLGHTLNLAGDISVTLAIGKASLEDFDMDTVYVLTELDTYKGNDKTGTKTLKLLPVEKGNYYYFTLSGLTAIHMNDRIRSVLYGTKEGQVYYSAIDDYSISDYAYSQMNKTTAKDSLKTLCADLLRYGAKAQIYKSYRTDHLADASMTAVQRGYLSDMDAVTFQNNNMVLNDLDGAEMIWVGKALDLASKVTLKLIFDPANYEGDMEKLSLRLTYEGADGKRKTATVEGAELYNGGYGFYAFSFDGLLAAELRTVVSARIYAGEDPVSCTLQYSCDTYGNGKTGTLQELCKALFAYSDSAFTYFSGK